MILIAWYQIIAMLEAIGYDQGWKVWNLPQKFKNKIAYYSWLKNLSFQSV